MYYASENSGAYLNGNRICVKDVKDLKDCVIGTGFPHRKDDIQGIINRLGRVLPHIRDLRRLGSPALDICWVACGRMQGFYEGTLSPWDVAAAKLIAIEAGAKVGHFKKEDNYHVLECINGNNIVVSSPRVFDELKHILA
jgi:myo-inositol-1(or 4)-monophosphatase